MAHNISDSVRYVTGIASTLLRLCAYVFLRWIPAHGCPPILWTLFAIYVPAFVYSFISTPPFEVISDEIEIITKEVEDDTAEVDPRYLNGDAKDPVEELDVQETLVVEEKDPQVLKTLLTGTPSPTSRLWSGITFAINLALILMAWDVVYRAMLFYPSHDLSMARVGYVSDTTAKVLIREPDLTKLPIFISYRHADPPLVRMEGSEIDTAWKSGGTIYHLDDSTDFTSTFELKHLKADTRYQYVANNHTGFFTTAPHVGETSNRMTNAGTFTFLHSSCLKNRLPYNPFDHPLSNRGLKSLSKALVGLKAQFMLFLGDFIYIDVPQRQGNSSAEDHRREYRQVYSSPDWPAVAKELPWIHVYDDHEVANDWDKNTTGFFAAANDPYQHYHVAANPPPVRKGETYFSFTQGPATFFILDTRRYRSPNDGTNGSDPITGEPTKTILGAKQRTDLLAWLKRSEPRGVRWKIVVSSIPFTKNWWFGAQDTWRGYLGERQIILEAMWDVSLQQSEAGVGVVVLSGDRHEFACTAFPPPPQGKEEITGLGPIGVGANALGLNVPDSGATLQTRTKRWPLSATVHEFSASPLNMFYLPYRTYMESSTSIDYVSDVCIKYLPDGQSKFGSVSISNPTTSDQSVLHYRLFVDGAEAWSYTLTSPGGGGRAGDAIWG